MHIVTFLSAVFGSWVAVVGTILTIISFVEKIPSVSKWLKEKPLLERWKPLVWVIGACCIFGGFYSAWSQQYDKATQGQNQINTLRHQLTALTVPDLHGTIDFAAFGSDVKHRRLCAMTVQLTITNTGAPSIADSFRMFVTLKNGREIEVEPILAPKTFAELYEGEAGKSPSMILTTKDYLPSKAISNPIPTGGAVSGFIQGYVVGATQNEVSAAGTVIRVAFQDVLSHHLVIEKLLTHKRDRFPASGG
ncbi:MAG TPA: hypothetical protein VNK23_06915 [Candidatus Dormibacteraeota bacterium]|nr:hypothetical protein [Candidatus Dormibacteraeota bacterium]